MRRVRSVRHGVENVHCGFGLEFEFSFFSWQGFNLIVLVLFILVVDLLDAFNELILVLIEKAVFLLMEFIF